MINLGQIRRIEELGAAIAVKAGTVGRDVAGEALIEGHDGGIALLRRVVPGDGEWVELVARAVGPRVRRDVESRPIERGGAERRCWAQTAIDRIERATRAARNGEAIGAIGSETGGDSAWQRRRGRAKRDRARSRRGERNSIVQPPGREIQAPFGGLVFALDRGIVIPLIAQRDIAAVPGPAPQLRGHVPVLASRCRRIAKLRDCAVKAALQDDVDHAGNGVGAVRRRSAVHQHVDAVLRDGGNDGGIDGAKAMALRWETHAINHQERTRGVAGVEATKVDAGRSFEVRARLGRDGTGRDIGGRYGAEQVGGGESARLCKIPRAQIGDGNTHRGGAADERSGDQDLLRHFLRIGLRHLCLGDLLSLRGQGASHSQQRR